MRQIRQTQSATGSAASDPAPRRCGFAPRSSPAWRPRHQDGEPEPRPECPAGYSAAKRNDPSARSGRWTRFLPPGPPARVPVPPGAGPAPEPRRRPLPLRRAGAQGSVPAQGRSGRIPSVSRAVCWRDAAVPRTSARSASSARKAEIRSGRYRPEPEVSPPAAGPRVQRCPARRLCFPAQGGQTDRLRTTDWRRRHTTCHCCWRHWSAVLPRGWR